MNTANAEENTAVSGYVDFYLENLTEFVEATGYVPLPDEQVQRHHGRLGRPLTR